MAGRGSWVRCEKVPRLDESRTSGREALRPISPSTPGTIGICLPRQRCGPSSTHLSIRPLDDFIARETASRDNRLDGQRYCPLFLSYYAEPRLNHMAIKRSHRDSVSEDEHSTSYSRETSVDIKIIHLDSDEAVSDHAAVMKCSLPPHEPLTFASFEEHHVHYQQVHMNRCSECQKNFPDQHYLHLHIAEYHDPINAAKRDQGEKTVCHGLLLS